MARRILFIILGVIPVSYTHLDVYKRQPQPRGHQPYDQSIKAGVVNVIALDPMTPRLPR